MTESVIAVPLKLATIPVQVVCGDLAVVGGVGLDGDEEGLSDTDVRDSESRWLSESLVALISTR